MYLALPCFIAAEKNLERWAKVCQYPFGHWAIVPKEGTCQGKYGGNICVFFTSWNNVLPHTPWNWRKDSDFVSSYNQVLRLGLKASMQTLVNTSTWYCYSSKIRRFVNYSCMNLWWISPKYLLQTRIEYLYFGRIWWIHRQSPCRDPVLVPRLVVSLWVWVDTENSPDKTPDINCLHAFSGNCLPLCFQIKGSCSTGFETCGKYVLIHVEHRPWYLL